MQLYAQDNIPTPPVNTQASSEQTINTNATLDLKYANLPASPSAQELADLFFSAGGDIDEAMKAIVSKGENAVEGLTQLLFFKPIRSSKAVRELGLKN